MRQTSMSACSRIGAALVSARPFQKPAGSADGKHVRQRVRQSRNRQQYVMGSPVSRVRMLRIADQKWEHGRDSCAEKVTGPRPNE